MDTLCMACRNYYPPRDMVETDFAIVCRECYDRNYSDMPATNNTYYHMHEWKNYIGLREVYVYCTVCDKKKEDVEKETGFSWS